MTHFKPLKMLPLLCTTVNKRGYKSSCQPSQIIPNEGYIPQKTAAQNSPKDSSPLLNYLSPTCFKMPALLTLLPALLLAVSVCAVPIDYSSNGRLHIITVTENTLEATFFNSNAGIRIRANNLSLSLTSMDGEELLLSAEKPHGSSLLGNILGHSFLEVNTTLEDGTTKMVDYIIPRSLSEQAKEAVESQKEERMLSQLREGTQEEVSSAFSELFRRPEILLIEGAAIALGRAGVMGYENQGALIFYMFAKGIIKSRGREEGAGEDWRDDEIIDGEETKGRQKREYCWNVGHSCPSGRCPIGTECLGRCGPGCYDCWWWVCLWYGSACCYNQGCYDHDTCCGRYGQLSFKCLVPIGFHCLGYIC